MNHRISTGILYFLFTVSTIARADHALFDQTEDQPLDCSSILTGTDIRGCPKATQKEKDAIGQIAQYLTPEVWKTKISETEQPPPQTPDEYHPPAFPPPGPDDKFWQKLKDALNISDTPKTMKISDTPKTRKDYEKEAKEKYLNMVKEKFQTDPDFEQTFKDLRTAIQARAKALETVDGYREFDEYKEIGNFLPRMDKALTKDEKVNLMWEIDTQVNRRVDPSKWIIVTDWPKKVAQN